MAYTPKESGPQEAILSAVHVIATIIFLVLITLGFGWVVNNILLRLFDWFNGIGLFWKVTLLIVGGFGVVQIVVGLSSSITAFLGILLYKRLPVNGFTTFSTGILSLAAFVWTMYLVWTLPVHFSFWIILELIVISTFALSLYYSVFMTTQITE
jgi:hypothetical protein